jgi:hypothetical protein
MSRKFRSTETSNDEVRVPQNGGQYMHSNYICVNCNAVASTPKHYTDCHNKEVYTIPSSAEAPRKNAKKRIWEIFKKQFVYVKPKGYWFDGDLSWWYKNNLK